MFSYGYKIKFIQKKKYIDMCRVFEMFEVKVPTIFFATEGLSLRREGRYQAALPATVSHNMY
jgi:hypothetical protein